MRKRLTASLVSRGPYAARNIVLPGNDVTFIFTNPPKNARNVQVKVMQDGTDVDDVPIAKHTGFLAGFLGDLTGGKFVVRRLFGAPPVGIPDPLLLPITHPDGAHAGRIWAELPEAERVSKHTLRLVVEYEIGGRRDVFVGKHRLEIRYPLAMIVPGGHAWHDASLNTVRAWSQQWHAHAPRMRLLVDVPVARLFRHPIDRDYDPLVDAFARAAAFSERGSGVVVLATGHGDAGDTRKFIPWCNLTPEDFPPPRGKVIDRYQLDIDEYDLADGTGRRGDFKANPGPVSAVRLRALDRIADRVAPFGIRRLILHTCHVAGSRSFMQHMADRLGVPVLSHRKEIEYVGFAGSGHVAAHYPDKRIVRPRDEHYWPVASLSGPVRPGSPPPRW